MKQFLLSILFVSTIYAVPSDGSKSPLSGSGKPTPGLHVEQFADQKQINAATALAIDEQGRVFVAKSNRFRGRGIDDNRHRRHWLMEDITLQSTEERLAMYKRWAHKHPMNTYTDFAEEIFLLEDTDQDGKADSSKLFAGGFNDPLDGTGIGLITKDGDVWFTCIPHVWRLSDKDGDGVAESRVSIQDGFGVRVSISGHDLHGLAWGMDGKLYFSVGDRGYNLDTQEGKHFQSPDSGAVFRCNPDGSDFELYYTGLRNPQELAFDKYGNLFTVDNNADIGDKSRVVYILEGGESGWHSGHQLLTTFKNDIDTGSIKNVGTLWLNERWWDRYNPGDINRPAFILPPVAHLTAGPSGLCYNPGESMPVRYQDHFFICDYKGSAGSSLIHSFATEPWGAGFKMVDAHPFYKSITCTDADFGYDGKLYVSDYGGGWTYSTRGGIIALSYPKNIQTPSVSETEKLFKSGFDQRCEEELSELLKHPDLRVRQRAQFSLAKRGKKGANVLLTAVSQKEHQLARLHGIWGLGQLKEGDKILPFLKDKDDEVRAQAVNTIGETGHPKAATILVGLLKDESPRVRSFAAIALNRLAKDVAKDPDWLPVAKDAVVNMLEDNASKDGWLAHAGVMGLVGQRSADNLVSLFDHQSPHVRKAVVLALRRFQDDRISHFLKDSDLSIVSEAARAINDLQIDTVMTALADLVAREDVHKLTQSIQHRVLNANLRAGQTANAINLITMASNSNVMPTLRQIALEMLWDWNSPPRNDTTTGKYRPLPVRNLQGEQIKEPLLALMENSTGNIQALATRLAGLYGLPISQSFLTKIVLNSKESSDLRISAIEQLASDPLSNSKSILERLVKDPDTSIRIAAAKILVESGEEKALPTILNALSDKNLETQRLGYAYLGDLKHPKVEGRLLEDLNLLQAGKLPIPLHLELLEAAQSSSSEKVAKQLAVYRNAIASTMTGPWKFSLEGGNPNAGRDIFNNQGTCLKCHSVRGFGGVAGPSLSDVAQRLSPEKLLESIVAPNAEVVPGYGLGSFTLKDGSAISGTVLKEENGKIQVRLSDNTTKTIYTHEIDSRTPTISSMPPLALILTKPQLRDLMAYLQTLR